MDTKITLTKLQRKEGDRGELFSSCSRLHLAYFMSEGGTTTIVRERKTKEKERERDHNDARMLRDHVGCAWKTVQLLLAAKASEKRS